MRESRFEAHIWHPPIRWCVGMTDCYGVMRWANDNRLKTGETDPEGKDIYAVIRPGDYIVLRDDGVKSVCAPLDFHRLYRAVLTTEG